MTRRASGTIRRHTITFASLFLAGAHGAWAEPIPWLYDVRVPVASQSDNERQRATRQAMIEVLIRMSGNAQVPMTSDIAAALAKPAHYTLRYQFTSLPRPALASAPPTPSGDQLLFDVRFDPVAVLELLRNAQLPIWSANRTNVLVWLAVRGPGHNDIVTASEAGAASTASAASIADAAGVTGDWAEAVNKRARQRGLAIAWPLLDLRDLEVSTAAVWGFFWEQIEAASRRYQPDLLLVGRAVRGHSGWWTDWELRQPAGFDAAGLDSTADALPRRERLRLRYNHQAVALEDAAKAAVDHIADALAARFAVRGDSARAFPATVHGTHTARDYATLLDHLTAQEYIERVDVLAATPRVLDIRLHTRSEIGQLAELLAQDDRLAVTPASGRMDITWLGHK